MRGPPLRASGNHRTSKSCRGGARLPPGLATLLLKPDVNLVVVTPELDPVLGREISRDGRVLYDAEENVWAWERLRLWQLYNDALPFLRRQKEDLRRYAEEVRQRGA